MPNDRKNTIWKRIWKIVWRYSPLVTAVSGLLASHFKLGMVNSQLLWLMIIIITIYIVIGVVVMFLRFNNAIAKSKRAIGELLSNVSKCSRIDKNCYRIVELLETHMADTAGYKPLAQFLHLDEIYASGARVDVIFSHKIDSEKDSYWSDVVSNDLKHRRGDLAKTSSSIPLILQESLLAMKLYGVVQSVLGDRRVRIKCSCEVGSEEEKLGDRNLILLGSSKTNSVTKRFIDKMLKQGDQPGLFASFIKCPGNSECTSGSRTGVCGETNMACIIANGIMCCPTVSNESQENMTHTDYALISCCKNPWAKENDSKYVFLFSGCRAAGALMLQILVNDNRVVHDLLNFQRSQDGNNVEVMFTVPYRMGGVLPNFSNDGTVFKVKMRKSNGDKASEYEYSCDKVSEEIQAMIEQ